MIKTSTTTTLIAIATSYLLLVITPTPKSTYHSLFVSNSLSDNASVSHHLQTLTRRPHIAGSEANHEAASYVISVFTSSNIPSHVASYEVALAYPLSRSLVLTNPPPQPPTTFTLKEETYEGDPYADVVDEVVPTFHAYAKSGTATGPVCYVNYGRVEDFMTLEKKGVNVSGTVVLARYGKIYRGDIVKNAYDAGAVGVVIFSDRKDYGGAKWFPDDKWLPPSGVQVGTVYGGVGDPTTPGWASGGECERLNKDEVEMEGDVPLIPSLPVSARDGEKIMRSIGGPVAEDDWQGSKDDLIYRVGPGPGILNLSYMGQEVITTIQNVIGVIEGAEEPDRFVIIGNHRDAWTFGAVDPNSGTAALLEIAQRMGKLQKRGWRPRRTIILCNWDAEEYGLIGSTEWVEENREILASRAVAYLNADCAVGGPGFSARATPQLDELIKRATQQVKDPDNSSQSIYESWTGNSGSSPLLGRLGGGGSDYASFLHHVGIPAADIDFGGAFPVYHSLYDDFIWMKKFGDPMFQRHVAAASVWGQVALWLADEEFLPFDYISYAKELQLSTEKLEDEISNKDINLLPIFKSIKELEKAAIKINNQIKEIGARKGWTTWKKDHLKVRELNDRLMMAERAFTDRDGLFGMSWYKHLIYGPSKHNDHGSQSFPGIDDAVKMAKNLNTVESWHHVQHEVWRVSRVIIHASLVLIGQLT
ncbi:probable glutamate carboxypeptidase LAMP1 [Abrus precatorius]|uniref:Probable glutamate carboxypeptidase LAMP1 n=1 Tax=Abrus precatorius TaxID=3816 RepID=A0A8B8LTF4_ABRPR|nr:probable glutamate carboxypeptidase LAMP1 [Abrus precatorius]XP_027358754.1 probable glutamate carboxypeptidase LAMP1 [Abrus precatorius]